MHTLFKRNQNKWLVKMGHCPCLGGKKKGKSPRNKENDDQMPALNADKSLVEVDVKSEPAMGASVLKDDDHAKGNTVIFSYRELATATNNFRRESLIGEGGFGAVYKGELETTGQAVAVKQLNLSGCQGEKEFLVEVLMLCLLRHPNLVNLIGYCAEGEQRLLVYEFMPLGSLEHHLHNLKSNMKPLDWNERMIIAAGAARGLNFLHNEANPPVIYRDLKSSNILLDEHFNPRLSDFGLAKFGPYDDKSHVSTRVMGTEGYCAPEYAGTGKLTMKSDIFSFGVVLLEIITGRKALDWRKEPLVDWARPMLRDRRNFIKMADPKLKGQFSKSSLCRVVDVAVMCLRSDPMARPSMTHVVHALDYLASQHYDPDAKTRRDRSPTELEGGLNSDTAAEDLPQSKLSSPEANKDPERERAVEEAKNWGKSWREKKQQRAQDDDAHDLNR